MASQQNQKFISKKLLKKKIKQQRDRRNG